MAMTVALVTVVWSQTASLLATFFSDEYKLTLLIYIIHVLFFCILAHFQGQISIGMLEQIPSR